MKWTFHKIEIQKKKCGDLRDICFSFIIENLDVSCTSNGFFVSSRIDQNRNLNVMNAHSLYDTGPSSYFYEYSKPEKNFKKKNYQSVFYGYE